MVKVTVDKEQKLVEAEISGMIKTEDAARASSEIKRTMYQFGPQEAVLLIDLVGFTPMTNDVLSVMRGIGRDVTTGFRKAALIQEFSMEMRGRKVIEPPPGKKIPTYPTREEALKYLLAVEE